MLKNILFFILALVGMSLCMIGYLWVLSQMGINCVLCA